MRQSSLLTCSFVQGFLAVDLSFFAANLLKIADGGCLPVVVALAVYTLMSTWELGRRGLDRVLRSRTLSIESLLTKVERDKPHRVPDTA